MGNSATKKLLNTTSECRPFLKWAGGKSQLLPNLLTCLPNSFERYFEPFLGGGALFFGVRPQRAFLSDINPELVNAYLVIRDNVEALIRELKKHRYESKYFYSVREWDRDPDFQKLSAIQRAGRLIFLNKTCFNGLYRVNSKGQFNVPFGRYTSPTIVDADNLRACSAALQGVDVLCESYLEVEGRVRRGDLVYFDPPYAPLSATSNFTGYVANGFDRDDQVALRDLCCRLNKKGVKFIVSNSSAPLIVDLYANFNLRLVDASRAINSKGAGRGKVKEAIITNFRA